MKHDKIRFGPIPHFLPRLGHGPRDRNVPCHGSWKSNEDTRADCVW